MYRIIGADGREYGPISAGQLRQWITEGRAIATTPVFVEGASEWKTLGALPEFSTLFAGAPAQTVFQASGSARGTNGFAVTGLVLGILSFVFCCCYGGIPFNVLGLVFSIIGLVQINREPRRYGGKGLAIAGIVLCVFSLFISFFTLVFVAASSGVDQIRHHHAYRL